MNAKAAEILAKKGITPATQHHDYQYLFKAVLQAMEEYHLLKSKEEAEERCKKAIKLLKFFGAYNDEAVENLIGIASGKEES